MTLTSRATLIAAATLVAWAFVASACSIVAMPPKITGMPRAR